MTKPVLVFFGLIATGKSLLARAWADGHGCLYLNSDIVRKELAGIDMEDRQASAFNAGIYRPDFTRLTYDEMITCTERALAAEKPACIVLDASYQSRREGDRLRDRLEKRCRMLFIHCTCPDETVKKRLMLRAADPRAVSDGRWDIFLQQKENFVLPLELGQQQLVSLDTDRPPAELLLLLEGKVKEMGMEFRQPLSAGEEGCC
jgi:hypothetical protein